MKIEKLLEGAFDLHVHAAPDVVPRAQTLPELARAAARAGLAGVLIKDHTASTVGRCFTMNKISTGSVRFFSALALNPPVGDSTLVPWNLRCAKVPTSFIFQPMAQRITSQSGVPESPLRPSPCLVPFIQVFPLWMKTENSEKSARRFCA